MKTLTTTDIVSAGTLLKIAERIKKEARSIARTKRAGKVGKKKGTIVIGVPKVTQNQVQINISLTSEAAAYEYGSGIHGNNKSKYPITAKNYPTLTFMGTNAWAGTLIWWRREIKHPGVAARPFLEPAKKATRQKNLEDFRKEAGDNIRLIVKGMSIKV